MLQNVFGDFLWSCADPLGKKQGQKYADCSFEAMNCLDENATPNSAGSARAIDAPSTTTPTSHLGLNRGSEIVVPGELSFQDAIVAASRHRCSIRILPGEHHLRQQVFVEGQVDIRGEPGTTIEGSLVFRKGSSGLLSGIEFRAPSTEFTGLLFSGGEWLMTQCNLTSGAPEPLPPSATQPLTAAGLLGVHGDARLELVDCKIGSAMTSRGSRGLLGKADDLWADGPINTELSGIVVSDLANIKVTSCQLQCLHTGVEVRGSGRAEFVKSSFHQLSVGLNLCDQSMVTTKNCTFQDMRRGCYMLNPSASLAKNLEETLSRSSSAAKSFKCSLVSKGNDFVNSEEFCATLLNGRSTLNPSTLKPLVSSTHQLLVPGIGKRTSSSSAINTQQSAVNAQRSSSVGQQPALVVRVRSDP